MTTIKEARAKQALTVKEVADKLGTTPEEVLQAEKDMYYKPSRLTVIRTSKFISRPELGAVIGKSAIYIARLEKGDIDIAYLYARHPEEVQAIADFLGVTVAEIL